MARVPMGKVLLRNVIRHTGAHNKIQEESEMWKMRDMEKHSSCHRQMPTMHVNRGHMHCDRLEDESRDRFGSQERGSGQDDRDARYWTRKLYEFEASDPDRWGHSGFKELYPEEFQIKGERGSGDKTKHRRKDKSKGSTETDKTKRSKKSSKKKKKKKEGKRRRRAGDESSGEESDGLKVKRSKKRSQSKHGRKKRGRRKEEESSSEDSDEEGGRGERTQSHRKPRRDSHRGTESGPEPQKKKRRKNWKSTNEERSEGSSDD